MPVTTCFRVFYIFELLIFCTSFHISMLKNWIFWQKVLILAYFFHYEGEKNCENPLQEKKIHITSFYWFSYLILKIYDYHWSDWNKFFPRYNFIETFSCKLNASSIKMYPLLRMIIRMRDSMSVMRCKDWKLMLF